MSDAPTNDQVVRESPFGRTVRLLIAIIMPLTVVLGIWIVHRRFETTVLESLAHGHALAALSNNHATGWVSNEPSRALLSEMISSLEGDIRSTIVRLPNHAVLVREDGHPLQVEEAAGGEEKIVLEELKKKWLSQWRAKGGWKSIDEPGTKVTDFHSFIVAAERVTASITANRDFIYYEPVAWGKNCFRCHQRPSEAGFVSKNDSLSIDSAAPEFRATKTVLPYPSIRPTVNRMRALSIAVALLVVPFSLVGSFLLVHRK